MGTSGGGDVTTPAHPVHNEDLVDVEFLLELLGGDGHRVEETETPVDKQTHVFIRTVTSGCSLTALAKSVNPFS